MFCDFTIIAYENVLLMRIMKLLKFEYLVAVKNYQGNVNEKNVRHLVCICIYKMFLNAVFISHFGNEKVNFIFYLPILKILKLLSPNNCKKLSDKL